MRTARLMAVLVAAAACSRSPDPTAAPAAPASASAATPVATAPFAMRDLAAATALDARLARLSLAASDVHAALPAGAGARPASAGAAPHETAARERAKALLPAVDAALAEARAATAAVAHPLDRPRAEAAFSAAQAFAGKLAAAVDGAPGAEAELLGARDAYGEAIVAYRTARAGWRLDAPEPTGAERDFAEARRELERIETTFAGRTRVAPREEGHELDAAALRMTGELAAGRARAAADQLAPPLRDGAARYAAAQARVLEAVTALRGAREGELAAASRRYHAAKADALEALADYFAALASR